MTTLIDILRAARQRIASPDQWCQGTYAQNASGDKVQSRDTRACRWCAKGALFAAGAQEHDLYGPCLDILEPEMEDNIADFNDHHTHPEVLAAFDRAIAKLEQP